MSPSTLNIIGPYHTQTFTNHHHTSLRYLRQQPETSWQTITTDRSIPYHIHPSIIEACCYHHLEVGISTAAEPLLGQTIFTILLLSVTITETTSPSAGDPPEVTPLAQSEQLPGRRHTSFQAYFRGDFSIHRKATMEHHHSIRQISTVARKSTTSSLAPSNHCTRLQALNHHTKVFNI